MKDIEDAVKVFDSRDDRALLAEECTADPAFCRKLRFTLSLPDGEKKVAMSARRAIMNELNPNLYPETKGLWKKLRSITRDLIGFISRAPGKQVVGMKAGSAMISNLNGLGELGQWEILGALITAGANVYTSYNQADTQKQLQQMQIDAQMRAIQAQETIARAQAAMAASQAQQAAAAAPVQAAVSNVMDMVSTPIMGVPLWAVAIGLYFLAEKA